MALGDPFKEGCSQARTMRILVRPDWRAPSTLSGGFHACAQAERYGGGRDEAQLEYVQGAQGSPPRSADSHGIGAGLGLGLPENLR